jgi:hypothetical protein
VILPSRVRVLVCGSREWKDGERIAAELRSLLDAGTEIAEVIHGAQRGADVLAGGAARGLGLRVTPYPADWKKYGKGAGHTRNQVMLNAEPDVVLAFKDNFDRTMSRGGTEHMVRIALAAGVPCRVVGKRA